MNYLLVFLRVDTHFTERFGGWGGGGGGGQVAPSDMGIRL